MAAKPWEPAQKAMVTKIFYRRRDKALSKKMLSRVSQSKKKLHKFQRVSSGSNAPKGVRSFFFSLIFVQLFVCGAVGKSPFGLVYFIVLRYFMPRT